jgi:hypothetical protein
LGCYRRLQWRRSAGVLKISTISAAAALLTKNPQKVSKDESSSIFKQTQESCQKNVFILEYPLSYGGFEAVLIINKHEPAW